MKPTVIPHPLKRIYFNYHSEAALSDFEKAFIARYKQLHDELASIKNQLLQLGPEIRKVMHELANVKKAFARLSDKIHVTEQMLGLVPANDIAPGEYRVKPGEINQVLTEFQAIRQDYWDMMVPMHDRFNAVFICFTAFDNTVEQFEKEFSQPLFRNFENMEIDVSCFDKDMNEFRVQWMAIAGLQDNCLDEYTEWAKHQTDLVNESSVLYEHIKKLFQHMSSLQKHTENEKKNGFGLN